LFGFVTRKEVIRVKNVKVYSTPTCSFCIRLKKFLDDNGVNYENIDVTESDSALDQMQEVSGQMGVPVVDIEGEIIVGFDKDRISELLGL